MRLTAGVDLEVKYISYITRSNRGLNVYHSKWVKKHIRLNWKVEIWDINFYTFYKTDFNGVIESYSTEIAHSAHGLHTNPSDTLSALIPIFSLVTS